MSYDNSAVKVGKEILVTGLSIQGVYKYNPESNNFSLLFLDSKGTCNRTIFKTSKKEVFLIVSGKSIFKSSKKNLCIWTEVGPCPKLGWNVTDRCENDGKVFYLDSDGKLNIFDIKSYEIKQKSLNFR